MKVILIIVSILLIAVVLLQAGKAESAQSALMGGNDSLFKIRKERGGELVYGVITYQNEINKLANTYLDGWTIDRLGNTDKAILQMGIYELVYTDTPDIVCINEAVELAKTYSDDDVRKMINAVLDKVYHSKNE